MTVQVLLGTYNGEAWLPELLQSLENQTDPDFRVLYQDDGSTDGTPELLADLSRRDPRFEAGKEQGKRLGAKGNFMSLIRQADGDAVMLCDQDDVWEPGKIARLRRAMAEAEHQYGRGTPLLIHSDCSGMDEKGAILFESFFRHQGWDPEATDLPRLLVQNNITGCTLIMNRRMTELAAALGDPDRMFMHDWFLGLTAASFGRILFLDEALTRYRQHGDNTIGASAGGQVSRGMQALSRWEKGKERMRLTYDHARSFREMTGDSLPAAAGQLIDAYLATEKLPKLQRIRAVRRLGCVMQSRVTRMGQIVFG